MEPASLYRKTLIRAWRTTRTHPHLWALGFLAALLGNGGEFEFIITQFNRFSTGDVFFGQSLLAMFGTGGSTVLGALAALMSRTGEDPLILGGVAFLALLSFALVVSAQGGLIRAVANPGSGTLGSHFEAGAKAFWQILGILIATRFLAFFVLGVVGMPLAALLLYFVDPIKSFTLVSFVLGVPLLMTSSLISKYAIAYRMLERANLRAAIARGFSLFFDHWLISIELVLTLFLLNVVAGGAMILGILALSAPFLALANTLALGMAGNIFLALGQLVGFLLLVAMGSILATFQYASWIELFLRISRERHASKIVRIVSALAAKYR